MITMPKAKWMYEIYEIYKILMDLIVELEQKKEETRELLKQSEEFLSDIPTQFVNQTYTIVGDKYDDSFDSFTRLFVRMRELENEIDDPKYDIVRYINVDRLKCLYRSVVYRVVRIQGDVVNLNKYGHARAFFKAVMIDSNMQVDQADKVYEALIAEKTNETE